MTTDGTAALNYRFDGPEDASLLLMVSSLGTTLEMWDPQVPALSERFRLLRPDTRGHGGSPVPPAPYSIDDLGRDVLALLDRLELGRVSYCGLSIGGMIGMWLASEAPERVERLALCSTSALLGPKEMWDQRIETVREQGVGALVDSVIGNWFTSPFFETGGEEVEQTRRMLASTPAEGYVGCCVAVRDMDLRSRLGDIRAPTLIISAEGDSSTPPEHGAFIHDSIPGSRFEVIPQAAHLANIERAEEFNRLLLDHLSPAAKGKSA